jgi:hypothetical protein
MRFGIPPVFRTGQHHNLEGLGPAKPNWNPPEPIPCPLPSDMRFKSSWIMDWRPDWRS